jgi:hypothetical protein
VVHRSIVLLTLAAMPIAAASEPPPRRAVAEPLGLDPAVAHVSAARELPDRRVLLTDARTPAVWILDPVAGRATRIGSPGAGPDQYVQPGGLYGGLDDTTLLLDRAQMRVMAVSADGRFGRTYSIAIKGTQFSSDADHDQHRIDARGFSYFADRTGPLTAPGRGGTRSLRLVRFDPVTQQRQPVAELRLPAAIARDMGNGLTVSRAIVGAPGDGWGVVPDGRVAVVRGEPYRVEWVGADGRVTSGPAIAHDVIPMTDADRQAYLARLAAGPSVGAGSAGGGLAPGIEPTFAPTKAPFAADEVVVSPDAQVWVSRTRPFGETTVIYDVFDRRGQRIDRLEFPAGSRVVGFGPLSVYVREDSPERKTVTLKKYRRPRAS